MSDTASSKETITLDSSLFNLLVNFDSISDDDVVVAKNGLKQLLADHSCPIDTPIGLAVNRFPENRDLETIEYQVNIYRNRTLIYRIDINTDRMVLNIINCTHDDKKAIRDSCELQELPIRLNERYTLHCKQLNQPYLTDHSTNQRIVLTIKCLMSESSAYCPLIGPIDQECTDLILLMPEHNDEKGFACALVRNAWGMNVAPAYIHLEQQTIYYNRVHNFDYPAGLAIRKTSDDLEIYFDNDEPIQQYIYQNRNLPKQITFSNMYPNNAWKAFDFGEKLAKLKSNVSLLAKYPEYKNLTEFGESNMDQGLAHFKAGEYDECVKCCNRLIEAGHRVYEAYYNLACVYSVQNEIDESIRHLELSIKADPNPRWCWNQTITDPDLSNVRDTPAFDQFVRENFDSFRLWM